MDRCTDNFDLIHYAKVENIKSRIRKSEEQIVQMDEQHAQIVKRLDRKYEQNHLDSRSRFLLGTAALKAKERSWMKQELDKLVFANNAYRDKSLISSSTGQEINTNNLQLLISNGTKNLVGERRLLKTIKENNKRGDHDSSSSSTDKFKCNRREYLSCHDLYARTNNDDRNEVCKRFRILESEWEKDFANIRVKGETWNSLGSKHELQDRIKIIEKETEKLRESVLEIRGRTKKVNKEMGTIRQDLTSLWAQYSAISWRRNNEKKNNLELKKELERILRYKV